MEACKQIAAFVAEPLQKQQFGQPKSLLLLSADAFIHWEKNRIDKMSFQGNLPVRLQRFIEERKRILISAPRKGSLLLQLEQAINHPHPIMKSIEIRINQANNIEQPRFDEFFSYLMREWRKVTL